MPRNARGSGWIDGSQTGSVETPRHADNPRNRLEFPASPIPEHRRNGAVSRPHVDGAGPTVASIARFELDCGALLDVFLIACHAEIWKKS
jgi:hypothetical protein